MSNFGGLDWPRWTGWAALGLSVVSALLNLVTPSRPERAIWAPVTLVMAWLAGYGVPVTQAGP